VTIREELLVIPEKERRYALVIVFVFPAPSVRNVHYVHHVHRLALTLKGGTLQHSPAAVRSANGPR